MLDLPTTLAVAGTLGTIVSVILGYIALRRTAKSPKPPHTPTSTLILGVPMHDHLIDLPGHHRRR